MPNYFERDGDYTGEDAYVVFFVFFIELRDPLILLPHLFRNLRQKVEHKMFKRFLWSMCDEFFVTLKLIIYLIQQRLLAVQVFSMCGNI